MSLKLSTSNNLILELQPGMPEDYKGIILKGSTAISAKASFAEIVLQQISGINYFIRLATGRFLTKINAKGWTGNYGLYSNFILKNDARKELTNIGKFHLRKNQYISYFTMESDCSVLFEKNEDFRTIDFFYSPKLLKELVPFFPELKPLLLETSQTILNEKVGWSIPFSGNMIKSFI